MKFYVRVFLSFCMVLSLVTTAAYAHTEYPILNMRQGDVDVITLLTKLSPVPIDVESVLATKTVIWGYGDSIDGIDSHRDIYTINDMLICIDEPAGRVHIEFQSATQEEFEIVEKQQHQKYDPNNTGYLSDGTTPLIIDTEFCSYGEPGYNGEFVDEWIHNFANLMGIEISTAPEWSFSYQSLYPDGQSINKGFACYAVIRYGLPVETLGLWSEVAINGYYVEGEDVQVEWYNNDVICVTFSLYTLMSEANPSGNLITEDQARSIISRELQNVITDEGELLVDLCYMPMVDPSSERNAIFVPAWRFRSHTADNTVHRINAYTGEIIR